MKIVAIQESFIDYPEHLSLVLFVNECPWNCVNCHNKKNLSELDVLDMSYVEEYVTLSKPLFNHFVISGGEPTYYDDLVDFIKFLKQDSGKVKLDTCGYSSKILKEALPFLDAVSMDVKAGFLDNDFSLYRDIARAELNTQNIIDSIQLLYEFAECGKYVEFRTTLLDKRINSYEVIDSIKEVLGGSLGKTVYTVSNEVILKNLNTL